MERISEEEKFEGDSAVMYDLFARKYMNAIYPLVADSALEKTKVNQGIVLDLGSGPGYLSIALAKKCQTMYVIGVDLSPDMIEIAIRNVKRENLKNIKFQNSDIHALPFPDEYADIIVSQGSLHHWRDPVLAFKEIYRVLKFQRFAFINDLRRDTPKKVIENVMNSIEKDFRPYFINSVRASYTILELKKILRVADIPNFKIFTGFEQKLLFKYLPIILRGPIMEPRGGEMSVHILIIK